MPVGKHVRFPLTNLPRPALSFNERSPASSLAAPLTPPNAYQSLLGPSPYTVSFSNSPARARIHPYLELSSVPAINYDLVHHPSSVHDHRHHRISSRVFTEPASTPLLRRLTIGSEHLPWTISISASNGSHATVGDVLHGVHRALRKNITPAEFSSLSSHDGRRAIRAYEQRYRRYRSTQAYEQEKRGGMKRIDFLMRKTKFWGLAMTSHGSDVWRLSVAWPADLPSSSGHQYDSRHPVSTGERSPYPLPPAAPPFARRHPVSAGVRSPYALPPAPPPFAQAPPPCAPSPPPCTLSPPPFAPSPPPFAPTPPPSAPAI